MSQIDIKGTDYSYSDAQNAALDDAAARVEKMRKGGALVGDALVKIRKFFRIKSIYHSNAIEGNSLDVGETKAVVEQGLTITGKPLKDHAEAKNLSHALDFLEQLAKQNDTPIRESDVRSIHGLVLKDVDDTNAGNYRKVSVAISGSNYSPPGPESVPAKMQKFGEWLSQATTKEILGDKNAILMAAVAHTWFVMEHPFVDGNGRVARLLMNLILMRAGFPIVIITKDDRMRYYDALEIAQSSDLSPFLALLLESMQESLEVYEEAAQDHQDSQEWVHSLASKMSHNARNEFEVWRNAMELLKSYFEKVTNSLNATPLAGNVYFKDFGPPEYEKYISLRYGKAAKRTWFFRVSFFIGERKARYLFFFGYASDQLKASHVTLHVAREEPSGSFRYVLLRDINASNVPDIHELGYRPEAEKFVAKGRYRPKQDKIEMIGQRFFQEVVDKHFSNW